VKYRPEIDGIRALAVLPVILFHAGFELFSGGFVGVDVFFVISGYLITTILIEDIENRRFSIVNFYERRARRILPALFFVMLVCIAFAWMWMLPSQMKDFSQSLVAVSLFASNILFWQESGYFEAAAEEKPLLHTWSLAVEEQYYVLFPIFLILAWRFGKNRVFWMIVVMAAISLLLSEWGWRNKATANFYLAPTRAWELFAGSIAAFIVQKQGIGKNNPLAISGLAAIIFSIFFYDETTPFPSVYALLPVLGVVLLVLYADKETVAAKLLSTKGFVGIGLISYSAYLWHQPLFVFARLQQFDDNISFLILVIATLLLAYFSWRLIERPFRNKNLLNQSQIFLFTISGMILFIVIGYLGYSNGGFKERIIHSQTTNDVYKGRRLTQNQNEFLAYFQDYIIRTDISEKYWFSCDFYDHDADPGWQTRMPREIDEKCTEKTQSQDVLFIWGDSHAQQYTHGIKSILGGNFAVRQIASTACPPKLVEENSTYDYCIKSNFEALKFVNEAKPKIVLLAQNDKHDLDSLEAIIGKLKELGVSKVLLMGPSPHWERDLSEILVWDIDNIPERLSLYQDNKILSLNETLKRHFSKHDGVIFVDVIEMLCDKQGCLVHFGGDVRSTLTTWDYGRLTPIASEFIAKNLKKLIF